MPDTTRYSDLVAAKLRRDLIFKDDTIFSTYFEGHVSAGSVKIPVRATEAVAGNYNSTTGIDPTTPTTTYQTVLINKDKAVNEIIDGFNAAAAPDDLIADRLDSAGYSLAAAIDIDSENALIEGGATELINMDATTPYDVIINMRTKLTKLNVPNDGRRFLMATADFYAQLLKDPNFIAASNLGDEIRQTGCVGRIAGFNVYEWNFTNSGIQFIVGHPNYCVRIREFTVPDKLVDLDGDSRFVGACAVKGRVAYAHHVTKASAIITVIHNAN